MTYIQYVRKHARTLNAWLWLKSWKRLSCIVSSLCAGKNPLSGQPCHTLVGRCHTFSLLMYHSTQHCLDRATFSKKILYTQNNFLMSPYQKLRQTQSGLKATQKNHSHTSTVRVPETCETTLPQDMSPTSLGPDRFWQFRQFLEVLLKIFVIFWCTERIWRPRSTSSSYGRNKRIWTNSSTGLTRSWDGVKCHLLRRCPTFQSQDALRRVHGKQCGLWSRRWRDQKVADFITLCPKSFLETRGNGHSGERGKCSNVSFTRRLESFRETGCRRNEQRNQMWSSVFGNANPSNSSGTLLEGNKDHLLNQAKSDLTNRELQVESLDKWTDDLQKRTEVQYRALQDVQNEFVESRREQTRFQQKENALRDTQIRSLHKRERKYNKLMRSRFKN